MLESQTNLIANTAVIRQWFYVTRRFSAFQRELQLKPEAIADADTKLKGVISSVNRAYRDESTIDYFMLVGSWGKGTAIRPPKDIDVLCFLPPEIYHQFNQRQGNKQSQLLQNVKEALSATYPQTQVRGDGQVVVIGFNSIMVEVVPAFLGQDGGVIICDTNNGGRWKTIAPGVEISTLANADVALNGNVRKVTRLAKQWQRHCNVPIKSFHIEKLAQEALLEMTWGGYNEFWFDWIMRDFFRYIYGRANGGFYMPGPYSEWIGFGDAWQSKAWSAYERACKACEYERDNMNLSAGAEWQKIFGNMIPEQAI